MMSSFLKKIKDYDFFISALKKFFNVYSEIFFSDNAILGAIIAVATLFDFNAGICGIIAIFSAVFFKYLTNEYYKEFYSYFYYNPLLVGISIGVLFKLSFLTVLLVFSAGILTYVFTVVLNYVFKKYAGLPVLSIPFVVVSSFVYLATLKSSALFANMLKYSAPVTYFNFPDWINGYFLSLGAIFFSKNIIVGIIISIVVFFHSRIMFMLTLVGYYTGALITGNFNSALSSTYSNLNYFNYILIAVAIGCVFLIPSIKSYIIAIFAVIASYVILGACEVLFSNYSIPVFTLPFNIIVLGFLYYSNITNSGLKTYTFMKTPEATLDFYINYTKRFELKLPSLALPFIGEWKISQGFDDSVTHKGLWKYGVDFVIENEDGLMYLGNYHDISGYFAYSKPVMSPASGTVVRIVNDVEDNIIGEVNREDNWGNYVTIYDARGFYVKVCHLKKNSVAVALGTYVAIGQKIGDCGNSGYSPFPHIHIQIQTTIKNSSPTIPFQFEQCADINGVFYPRIDPQKGKILTPVFISPSKKKVFELLLNDTFKYVIKVNEKSVEEEISVILDLDGSSFLYCRGSKLYFEIYKNIFRFYKYIGSSDNILSYFYLSIPSFILSDNKFVWNDLTPLDISMNKCKKNIMLFLQSFVLGISGNNVKLEIKDKNRVVSVNETKFMTKKLNSYSSEIIIDDNKFIKYVKIEGKNKIIEIIKQGDSDEKIVS